jgi:hypothetical protein
MTRVRILCGRMGDIDMMEIELQKLHLMVRSDANIGAAWGENVPNSGANTIVSPVEFQIIHKGPSLRYLYPSFVDIFGGAAYETGYTTYLHERWDVMRS